MSADQTLAALKSMRAAYGRLHDMLSEVIEDGRLREADIPDDYHAIVKQLIGPCGVADNLAETAITRAERAALEREVSVKIMKRVARGMSVRDAWDEVLGSAISFTEFAGSLYDAFRAANASQRDAAELARIENAFAELDTLTGLKPARPVDPSAIPRADGQ